MRAVINSSNLPLAFIRLPLYPSIFSSRRSAAAAASRCRRHQQMMECFSNTCVLVCHDAFNNTFSSGIPSFCNSLLVAILAIATEMLTLARPHKSNIE